jgi:tyrosinase
MAAAWLAPRFGGAQGAPRALRTRRNVASTGALKDVELLHRGVEEMKKLIATKPSDPRGWVLQAFIHGDCGGFTDCQHGNWYFAPWHRSFIYYFEQLIQHFSGHDGFALPYWDWSRTHGVPDLFYGRGNALDDTVSIRSSCPSAPTAGRGRSVTDRFSQADLDAYVGSKVVNRIQDNADFTTYGGGNPGRGELEGTPHNFVHRWVGGSKGSNMVQYFSPLDPIFWMHHCNIDRLYSNWLARPGHRPPAQSAWQDKAFEDFYDRDGKRAGSEFPCGKTVDSTVMGYVYDEKLDMPAALAVRGRAAGTPEIVGSVAASKASVQGGVLSFVTDAAPQTQTRRLMNAAAAGTSRYVVRLRIDGVKVPKRQNTGVEVFLGTGVTAETPITAPGYVGSFTFFDGEGGGGGGGHHHGESGVMLLNATRAVQELYGDTSLPEGANLSVSFVTKALYEGVDAFATVEEIRPDRIQVDVVDLGA